jgi:hypothetical protein
VLRSAFEGVDTLPTAGATGDPQRPLVTLFQDLTRKWYAPIAVTPETASRLADAYTELMTRLASDPDTRPLFDELQSGQRSPHAATPLPTAIVSAVMTVLQLMENVHTEFRFELPLNVQNPRNEGWISTFRRWAQTPILYDEVWQKRNLRADYHRGFQDFVEALHRPSAAERDVL